MNWTIVNLPNVNNPKTQGQPGVSVLVFRDLWEKIAKKHFKQDPIPWKELLGEKLFEQVGRRDEKSMLEATKKILPELVKSMATPLVIFHLVKAKSVRVWLSVLPCGLKVCIRRPHKAGQRKLASFHFKGKASQGLLAYSADASIQALVKDLPWKHAVEHSVLRYTSNNLTLPHTLDEIEIPAMNKQKEIAHQIDFISPAQWGFESSQEGAKWKMPEEYPEPLWEFELAKVVVEP